MAHSFFGIQVVIHSPPSDLIRDRLWERVRRSPGDQTLATKRLFYQGVTDVLIEAASKFRMGYWDYLTDDAAESAYDEWVSGLEASAASNPGDEVDDEHMLVTLVFLVVSGSTSDTTLAERCDLPESTWATRATYVHLLQTVRMLAFASVRADGAYVVPGEGGPGLSRAELTGPDWNYLVPIAP